MGPKVFSQSPSSSVSLIKRSSQLADEEWSDWTVLHWAKSILLRFLFYLWGAWLNYTIYFSNNWVWCFLTFIVFCFFGSFYLITLAVLYVVNSDFIGLSPLILAAKKSFENNLVTPLKFELVIFRVSLFSGL